ncbi:MAG TPA: NrfD/PsrC family molybdoenzyme membrane anchor subunit, partial [Verrucomicrobiae bacterium]|nr:NrfD/PsrC family molybdoenzyme membrane anchor subunit [Verrucomicrobiae bacterium]
LATIKSIMAGPFAWLFWGVQMLIGVIVPLFIFFNSRFNQSVKAITVGALMVVVGILAVRFNIVLPALTVPVMQGLPEGHYVPALTEWMSSFGVVALGLFIYTLAVKFLPVDELDEITGRE